MNKNRLRDLIRKKKNNQKAVLITAYDYSSARILDSCSVDAVLMGDSAAMVMLGYESTIEISLEEIIMLAKAVRRGLTIPYFIVDMPFLSYQPSMEEAIKNCGRVLKETHCDCVKMEGDLDFLDIIRGVINTGIPVCGHIGMTPQKYKIYNGYPVKGKKAKDAERIINSAIALEKAGIAMLIIENVPSEVSAYISRILKIPVYSIGSGIDTDGQIIVYHDILGLFKDFKPHFISQYEKLSTRIETAVNRYASDVINMKFPRKNKIFHLKREETEKLKHIFPDF